MNRRVDLDILKVAIRAAVLMPICLIVTGLLLGKDAQPFAAFGSFVILTLVPFAGRPLPRTLAWMLFVVAGCLLIAVGTAASTVPVVAVIVAGAASFLIFFSGVINPYIAAAKTGAILLLALPLMVPGDPAEIGIRVAGWLVACLICIPATYLVCRTPWIGALRRQAGETSLALAQLVIHPGDLERMRAAEKAVWGLSRRFTESASRPTGSSGASASVAALVDRLSWLYELAVSTDDSKSAPRSDSLRSRVSDLLVACEKVLAGQVVELPTQPVEAEIRRLQLETNHQVLREASGDEAATGNDPALRSEFRLAKLGWVSLEVSAATTVILERERKRGPSQRLRSWARVWAPRELSAASRLITEHSALRSTWLRNSIRSAIGITLAVLAAELLAVQNAFWVVLGTLTVLRSNALGTRQSALRAVLGTVAGIVLGSVLLLAAGSDKTVLWVMFPFAILFASYASKAWSLGAGQAGFATMVLILYNLTSPVGWEIGLVRLQDVAIGCGISLLVGFLVWPRGAKPLIRTALATSYSFAADLLAERSRLVLLGSDHDADEAGAKSSSAANARLDAALRQYLDEKGGGADGVNEDLVALCAGGFRLSRTAAEIANIPSAEWYSPSSPGVAGSLIEAVDELADWYRSAGPRLDKGEAGCEAPARLRLSLAGPCRFDSEPEGAVLGRFWVSQNIQYLAELSERYVDRSRSLSHKSGATG